ncbi:MAG: hypothetical protein M3Y82_05830 [Verrucomicrobiota bacterium]|nr:hypothetical protein [Verrucomicrobiota bacterium]
MTITRETVAGKLAGYLRPELSLVALVEWAENAMFNDELEERDFEFIRSAIAKLGLADVRAFGLTWEDCQTLLQRLGYSVRVDVVAA